MASSQGVPSDSKTHFWKKNSKNVPGSITSVYGAQYPPRKEPVPVSTVTNSPKKEHRGKGKDSFQDFEDNTIDAWDDGDDDLLVMNPQMVQSTALQVLNNHSLQQAKVKAMQSQTMQRLTQTTNGNGTAQSSAIASRPGSGGPGLGVRLNHWQHAPRTSPILNDTTAMPSKQSARLDKFKALFESPQLEMSELMSLAWSGCPREYRPVTWKILSGYLPPNLDRRKPTLDRKRQEYNGYIDQYYETRHTDLHKDTFRQIAIDIPRMSPLIPIFQQRVVQEIFERILYIWAIRHPASGYVQGINDLVTPFFVVFLTEYISNDVEIENCDLSELPEEERKKLEADSFWCFSKLLDGIQENYTFAQPGIQKKVAALKELVSRIDLNLHTHLTTNNVEYLQFSFRWMNNLLMREMPLRCVIRLWDTCLAEQDGFSSFYLYICAAFLTKFSEELKQQQEFQGIMIMLQNLTTHNWNNEHIGELLAEAFKLKYMFADAPRHLLQKPS